MIMLMLIPSVFSVGTCSLGSYQYSPGESALMQCECSLPIEESVNGFMVWRNSSGVILQNSSVNSGSCRTSAFGNTYFFLSGSDWIGNVTFETTTASWASADDVINDTYNVTGSATSDCIITYLGGTENEDLALGRKALSYIRVTDGITGDRLIHATCNAEAETIDDTPISRTPSIANYNSFLFTQSDGHLIFEHEMNEPGWNPGMSYVGEYYCYCLNDTTITGEEHRCYDESGNNAGFKSCKLEKIITPLGEDLRSQDNSGLGGASIAVIIFILFISTTIFFFPFIMDYFRTPFANNMFLDVILRRCCFLLGTYLMQLNSAMVLTIAGNSSLLIGKNLIFYLWFFGMAGYVYMIYIVFMTLADLLVMIQERKNNDRGF